MLRDHIDEMIEMYAQGYSQREIAEKFGVTRQRVQQLIAGSYDRPHRGERRRKERQQRIQTANAQLQTGASTLEVEADNLGVKPASLVAAFYRLGLKMPSRDSPLHGTLYRYQRGCRCDECRGAARASRQLMLRREPPEHGTYSAYNNYACRCADCLAAGRRWRRARKNRAGTPLD